VFILDEKTQSCRKVPGHYWRLSLAGGGLVLFAPQREKREEEVKQASRGTGTQAERRLVLLVGVWSGYVIMPCTA
jgi:hypothetical protein